MSDSLNIADALFARAAEAPSRVALIERGRRGERTTTYRELAGEVSTVAANLADIGIVPGLRVALMVKPGRAFFVLMFALFRAGAVPVLIDPGIDRRMLKQCLDEAAPEAFVGIPLAHAARIALGWARASVRILVTVGPRWFWGGHRYRDLAAGARSALRPLRHQDGAPPAATVGGASAPTRDATLAAILFTSGSTGVPKGVEYTHANFAAQVAMIRDAFDIRPGEVDLPTFAPFALFDPALGMTTVLPRMDFARPGNADPRELVEAIVRHRVTTMFGSPAVLELLARHGARLPGVRRVISAGAPVRPEIVAAVRALLDPGAAIYTPYGATECLPVAIVEAQEIETIGAAGTARGEGILVGRPVAPNDVRIIAIDDAPIAAFGDARVVAAGTIGEITVAGPTATARYFRRDAATAAAKLRERVAGAGERIVHRMGDLGAFDAQGRLWYAGRKSHRVETIAGPRYTETVEGVFNTHRAVRRTALVGVGARGAQRPVVCVELAAGEGADAWPRIERELRAIGEENRVTRGIATFLLHARFPVDIRHNAKIARERLALWAAQRLARDSGTERR